MSIRRFKYKVTPPPCGPCGRTIDHQSVEAWLNDMDSQGWELVGYSQKHHYQSVPQEWWVFRQPLNEKAAP